MDAREPGFVQGAPVLLVCANRTFLVIWCAVYVLHYFMGAFYVVDIRSVDECCFKADWSSKSSEHRFAEAGMNGAF